ncbi:MAG: phosphoadenosine phosphosulfate reductase family protein, partial [Gammaproteobacteria bacterium]|nr:phosphoadenosine phosphosulfate reductase family protein [Gammaproteobacteria bacterium]
MTGAVRSDLPVGLARFDFVADNAALHDAAPWEVAAWVLERARNPVISTNFRPLSAGLLHMVTAIKPDIPVIWVDSGYNTESTYRFAEQLIQDLHLNIHVYTPRLTAARRTAIHGGIPPLDDEAAHASFTREVKLEPFDRALYQLAPDAWFTGIRRDQTEYRKTLDVLSGGPHGITRVAPLFYWTEVDLEG